MSTEILIDLSKYRETPDNDILYFGEDWITETGFLMKINVGGSWKDVTEIYVLNETWKPVTSVHTLQDGTWKT